MVSACAGTSSSTLITWSFEPSATARSKAISKARKAPSDPSFAISIRWNIVLHPKHIHVGQCDHAGIHHAFHDRKQLVNPVLRVDNYDDNRLVVRNQVAPVDLRGFAV